MISKKSVTQILFFLFFASGIANAEENVWLAKLEKPDVSRYSSTNGNEVDKNEGNGAGLSSLAEPELKGSELKDEDLGLIRGRALGVAPIDLHNHHRTSAIILWDEREQFGKTVNQHQGNGQSLDTISFQRR
jgi:hypothetical protein